MKLIHEENYENMSRTGAEVILDTIRNKPNAVICLATESSPKRMYEMICDTINKEKIDISQVTFVKLDEWYGVEPDDSCTCTSFFKQNVIDRLDMPFKEFVEVSSNTKDIEKDLTELDAFLEEHPIDVMILGLGMNGHLGLNEPAEYLSLACHYTELSEKTKTHDMVKGKVPKGGLTIGLQGIFSAEKVLMLVCGDRKEEAFKEFMSKRISTATPASLLWLHRNCITIVDDESFKE